MSRHAPAARRIAVAAEYLFALVLVYFVASLPAGGGPAVRLRQALLGAGIAAAGGAAWWLGKGRRGGRAAAGGLAALVVALEVAWLPVLIELCYTTAGARVEVALIGLAGALQAIVLAAVLTSGRRRTNPRARSGGGRGHAEHAGG